MCTVSWLRESDGYQLLCNRDEKLSRAPAFPPQVRERRGVRYVAPIDGDFGGAWIATNELGVSICLLNGAGRSVQVKTGGGRSRGLLLIDLITGSGSLEDVDLKPYAPFTLTVLEPDQPASVMEWDGFERVVVPYAEPCMPLVSSSFDHEGVRKRRQEEFARRLDAAGKLDASVLFAFHGSHGRQKGAYSPCMHRADARTVSFSWVRVKHGVVDFFYTPDAPCSWSPGQTQTLELKR